MGERRFSFLQIFLAVLAIGFAVAVVARIRSFRASRLTNVGGASATINAPSEETTPSPVVPATVTYAKTSVATTSATRAARQQAFRELLNAPPPHATGSIAATPPPKAAPKPQSMLAKLVDPIKKLFNNDSAAKPNPKPASQALTKTPETPGGNGGDHSKDKDPTTDTTPPQVTGIAFDPQQISDGDTASVIVTAVDDLSGIRGISGTLTSPTGKALQGFAAQREADNSNRYIGRVTIPKDAESGLWHINFLNLSDNAANSATLSYAQSPILQSAALKVVSSRPDNTPPQLKAVWLDRRAMRAGEKNTLYIQAEDDKSGVNLVSGDFLSPSKFARIGFACKNPGDTADVWPCEFTPPTCLDCGDWVLEQIQLQDKASNIGAVRQDNPLVGAIRVNIMGDSCDAEPPVLQSVQLDVSVVPSTADGTFVNVAVRVSDDMCGMGSVSAQVIGPAGGNGQFFPFAQSGGDPNTWVGRMPIPRLAGRGIWRINWLQVMDKGNNLRVYYANDPLLQNAVVQVR